MGSIEDFLPHRPPFRFVDSLIRLFDDGAECELALTGDDPRLQQGRLAPLFLLEALAHTTAVFHGAQNTTSEKSPDSGMLVQIGDAQFFSSAHAGDRVFLHVKRVHSLGRFARFAGVASVGDKPLVKADLTVVRELRDIDDAH